MVADVPLTPVYTVVLTHSGEVVIDGKRIIPGQAEEPRITAISELHRISALKGRPVRAVAKEVTGICTPIIVDTSGNVIALPHPHPSPPENENVAEHPLWSAPLPSWLLSYISRVREEEARGNIVGAIKHAQEIEDQVTSSHGPYHPWTVNVLTLRSWLTLNAMRDWGEITDVLIETARRRSEAHAPYAETVRVIRNAHAAWRRLPSSEALRRASDLLDFLGAEPERHADVLAWVRSATQTP